LFPDCVGIAIDLQVKLASLRP